MKTSSFKYYTGDMGVAICLYPPIDWTGLRFPALKPEREIFFAIKNGQLTQQEYEKLYREHTLGRLDPRTILNMFNKNVLLCWEDPWFDQNGNIRNEGRGFCHRHIVSKWIWENLHIEVQEWKKEKDNIIFKTNPLF